MKTWQYLVTVVLGATCLVLALMLWKTGKSAQNLQLDLQRQQMEVNNGLLSQRGQQLGNSILQDMVVSSANNQRMHKLLGENGYNIQFQQTPPSNTPAATPKKQVTP
jgi:hypothetical protein